MRTRSVAVAFMIAGAALALAGCRSCGDETAPTRGSPSSSAARGPAIPTGMLVPNGAGGDAAPAVTPPAAVDLRLARDIKSGAWAELQVAAEGDRADRASFEHFHADSRFLSIEAMTLMHDAFVRALPGFDLLVPRLFSPDALNRLAVELSAFGKEWSAVPTLASAKARWPSSSFVGGLRDDGEWGAARATLEATVRELADLVRHLASKGKSLWVLGS